MKRWKCTVCGQIFTGELPPVPCPVCGAGEDAFVLLSDEGADALFRRDSSDRHVIVGGGAAALSAAKAIRARDTTCSIAMIAGEGVIPYNRPTLSDALADGNSFESMALEPHAFFAQNRIELITHARCASIDADARIAKLEGGAELPYDRLLLATGANPFNPIARDDDAIPAFTLRSFADMAAIAETAKGGKRALVVGGGILGLEAALALYQLGCKVTVCELGERVLSLQADEHGSARIRSELEALGIAVLTGKSASRLTKTGAELTDGGALQADFALISIGVRSELTLAKQLGLTVNRGIVVDDAMQTSHKDIYAAGDCAEFDGRVAGLWAAAVDQGTAAGAAMAGDTDARYAPIVPATAFEVGGLTMFSAGTLSGKQHLTAIDQRTGVYRRLYFDANRLVGAMFLNDTSKSAQTLALIASGSAPAGAKAVL